MSPSPRHWSWWRRHADHLVIAGLVVAMAMITGYNVWAKRVTDRNNHTAAVAQSTAKKVTRLTAGQCASTRFTFDLFNALAEDSSLHFGSPRDGPIVPGARDGLLRKLYVAERKAAAPLRKQGCRIDVPSG